MRPNEGGSIDQLPSGRWRLRVRVDGRQRTYGIFESEEDAFRAQARWRLTHLLAGDDPQLQAEVPANVAVGGVRCDEWFERWQATKRGRRSVVRVGRGRGGADTTAARDLRQWSRWWSPRIGDRLPQTISRDDLAGVLREMESAGRAPNTIRTHWVMIRAFFNWLVGTDVLATSPAEGVTLGVGLAGVRAEQADLGGPDGLLARVLRSGRQPRRRSRDGNVLGRQAQEGHRRRSRRTTSLIPAAAHGHTSWLVFGPKRASDVPMVGRRDLDGARLQLESVQRQPPLVCRRIMAAHLVLRLQSKAARSRRSGRWAV